MLAPINTIDADIVELDATIEEVITLSAQAGAQLDEVPGISGWLLPLRMDA